MMGATKKPAGPELKKLILERIYSLFDSWSSQIGFACQKGCATCCTQDVTMTAVEGDLINGFIALQNKQQWLTEKLSKGLPDHHLVCTTNEYARACLEGDEIDPGGGVFNKICPFLEKEFCTIYQVRPFSCRVFASKETCRKGVSASLPEYYLSGATAVSQIIEHLAQGRAWGNMLHVLALQTTDDVSQIEQRCRTAQPLPGFLIGETDYPSVAPLIKQIFNAEIGGRKIEDILNGN
jgi:Fe-S-cluster containining protein